ncbi:hypothetical protein [Catalinimonas niigatensis]|uniref:hypothetical protein n=1 Tax=Catalinimonas niigatensis TaxID=1397264 RepID=UPI0026658931|nr:hypothetical protein [Catalinimonas niigatensis]WPP48931.1 hypothetical protein PZB72_19890 [Catalinimonas niigatensis]
MMLIVLALAFVPFQMKAQSLQDSVNVLYTSYFELLGKVERVDSLSTKIVDIENRYDSFNELIESSNVKIKELTDKDFFSLQTQLANKRTKLINTCDFVEAADVSLNTILLLDAVTAYLNDVSALNSPDNKELGFSLNSEITSILEKKIIKGNKKINGGRAEKFLTVVDDILKNPLTDAVSSAVPVVASIKSVVDLVLGAATRGKDVSVDDVVAFKTDLKLYIEHYEGLAKAQVNFSQKINSVEVRTEALMLLLKQYTTERATTLYPKLSKSELAGRTITQILTDHYSRDNVQKEVDLIISKNPDDFNKLLSDARLVYPEYGLSQAKFIRDEIEYLGNEYIAAYESYQLSINAVLEKSKKIGDPVEIDKKIKELDGKLDFLEASFTNALNLDKLNNKFLALSSYPPALSATIKSSTDLGN